MRSRGKDSNEEIEREGRRNETGYGMDEIISLYREATRETKGVEAFLILQGKVFTNQSWRSQCVASAA